MKFFKPVLKGKTIYRILMDNLVEKECADLGHDVLDLAGGGAPSYYDRLPKDIHLIRTNRFAGEGIDAPVDFNNELPYADGSFDTVLFFNALYVAEDRESLMKEIHRILRPSGRAFIASPFISNEMPEPHDYCRLTHEGLAKLFQSSGFSQYRIIRFGERFSVSAYLLHSFFLFSFIRLFVYPLALFLDMLIPRGVRKNHPTPLGYFCILKK
ncbi:MAG: methyltransferase domain-containing protein [Candidatus Harrisonbacteria bacterium]|nr:methyltransferase domain-containing protein [Candidatus Harrisonbacteria bacterium]